MHRHCYLSPPSLLAIKSRIKGPSVDLREAMMKVVSPTPQDSADGMRVWLKVGAFEYYFLSNYQEMRELW